MNKSTIKLMAQNGIKPYYRTIGLLAEFALQSSGIQMRNYFDESRHPDGVKAYQNETRQIGKDLSRFKHALAECGELQVPESFILEASKGSRLQWKNDKWEYCTGQYFPTEYRKAAASLLERANATFRQSKPAQERTIETIEELKELAHENGSHWFSDSTMAYFGTEIESDIIDGQYFISSEQPPHGGRTFTIRKFDSKANVLTVGEFSKYESFKEAMADLEKLVDAPINA